MIIRLSKLSSLYRLNEKGLALDFGQIFAEKIKKKFNEPYFLAYAKT